jgi:hypothetical protein
VTRLLLVLVLLLPPTLLGALPAHAQEDEGWDAGAYDDGAYDEAPGPDDEAPDPAALGAYGSWTDDGTYGRVWRPSVALGWEPYVDGYWAWTPYGWTWVSYEPWSWTFHYGRWAEASVGWVWVPGSVWGPAWVDWYWGDGFVGWAPLPPFGVTVINQFVFVHERDFCSRHLARTVVDHHLVPNDVVHGWQHRDRTHGRPPGLHHIERASGRPVPRFDRRPPGSRAPRRADGTRLARPGVVPRLGAARGTEARLGSPWRLGGAQGTATAQPRLVREGGQPNLARPGVVPRLGAARGGGTAVAAARPPDWAVPRRDPGVAPRPPVQRAQAPSFRAPAPGRGALRMPAPRLPGAIGGFRGGAPGGGGRRGGLHGRGR